MTYALTTVSLVSAAVVGGVGALLVFGNWGRVMKNEEGKMGLGYLLAGSALTASGEMTCVQSHWNASLLHGMLFFFAGVMLNSGSQFWASVVALPPTAIMLLVTVSAVGGVSSAFRLMFDWRALRNKPLIPLTLVSTGVSTIGHTMNFVRLLK